MKRRSFLQTSVAVTAFAGLSTSFSSNAFSREPISRSGPSRFQMGLAAYSFRDYFSFMKGKAKKPKNDAPAIDMNGFIDYCVENQFDAAELTSYFFPADADTNYFLNLKRRAFERGVVIAGTAIGNDFTVGKGPKLDAQIDEAKQWIDKAAIMGAPHVRFFAGTRKEIDEQPERIDEAIEALEECAQYAGQKGIYLGVENHGQLTAEQCMTIMNRVQSPWVGMNLDTGNFNSDDPYADLQRCAPFAVNVQVKTTMKFANGETSEADLPRITEILRNVGYQGFVVLEFEEVNPYENVPKAAKRLREALKQSHSQE